METIDLVHDVPRRRPLDTSREPDQGADRNYQAADFFRQAGAVLAICLALAMLAQALILIVGEY